MRDRELTHVIIAGTAHTGYLATWRVDCGCAYVSRDQALVPGDIVQCSQHP